MSSIRIGSHYIPITPYLEEKGVLERTVYPAVPVTVEYTITTKGMDLHVICHEMKVWAARWT